MFGSSKKKRETKSSKDSKISREILGLTKSAKHAKIKNQTNIGHTVAVLVT